MKAFACGSVVPGCGATFVAESTDEVVAQVERHARDAHGMAGVPPSVLEQVRREIRDTSSGTQN